MAVNDLDHLTQLGTRATFDAALSKHFEEATADQPAALIISDIDSFKKVNDQHGHQTGDAVLRELALRLGQTVQGKGFAYRYGGEEFAVILPNHAVDEAIAVAERARRRVERSRRDTRLAATRKARPRTTSELPVRLS
jgi:diguanylate cyclase (GGDEF)-like protein